METEKRKWLPYLVYALLSLAILGPLLLPGYTLTLDMIFTPDMDFTAQLYGLSESISARTPLLLLIQLVSDIIPAWLVQTVILFLIFFLAGLGAHKLIPFKGAGSYFAGLLYMINPFIYVRFMAGLWPLLAAYALIPFAVKAFLELQEKGGMKNAIKLTLLSTLVGVMLVHGLFLLLFVFLVIFVVKLIKERKNKTQLRQVSKYVGISAAIFLVLNVYWLIPVLTAGTARLEQIGQADILLFAPKAAGGVGVAFALASMHGFWNPGWIYASNFIPFWPVLFIFILFLAVYGFLSVLKDKKVRWVGISLAFAGIIGFVFAVGASLNLTRPAFEWFFDNLVFVRGFRDSHKFVALLCLSYAYLGGLGVEALSVAFRQRRKRLLRLVANLFIILVFLVPLFYSFPIFSSWGQLKATDYPEEWHEVNEYLNQDDDDFNVLFLPWHLYMDYSWLPNSNKRLANPAQQFFDKPTIRGDNLEIAGKYSGSTNPISKYVEFLLGNASNVSNLGELLASLNVKYVLLVHEVDYASYDFLYQQEDLTVELEKPGITLLKNEHPTARVYGVNSVVYINSLEEYLELSIEQDVMEHLYVIGSGPSGHDSAQMEKLAVTEKSPTAYLTDGTSQEYTIVTVPQNMSTQYWEYNGNKPPLQNLGFMPAFTSSPDGGEIVYTRFYHVYLPSYIVSTVALTAALGVMVCFYFRRSKEKRL